jgi:1,4-dihydroxy-2-naphthoyl-CoA hydrolase
LTFFAPDIAALIPPTPVPLGDSFDALYGLTVTELGPERVAGHVPVRDAIKQPAGIVHGGVFASVAETLASWGTAAGTFTEGKLAIGLSNQTSFLRPVSDGQIAAAGTRRHAGRSTWVWDVELSDASGRLCAVSRVTVAVTTPDRAPEARDRPDEATG